MKIKHRPSQVLRPASALVAAFALAVVAGCATPKPPPAPAAPEKALIDTLNTGTVPQQQEACRTLARTGTAAAVPALAARLGSPELAVWARTALQNIPGPATTRAIRDMLPLLKGPELAGALTTLGVLRDTEAVPLLRLQLNHPDPVVAEAAAHALAVIGGRPARSALEDALHTPPASILADARERRTAVFADALLLLGANLEKSGDLRSARAVFGKLAGDTALPTAVRRAAWLGQMRTLGADALAPVMAAWAGTNTETFAWARAAVRDLPAETVAGAFVKELPNLKGERRIAALELLGDLGVASTHDALASFAKSEAPVAERKAALSALIRGAPASGTARFLDLNLLVDLAASSDATLAQAALEALAGFNGPELEPQVLTWLDSPDAARARVAREVVHLRGMRIAIPILLSQLEIKDPAVHDRVLAILRPMIGGGEVEVLLDRVHSTSNPAYREELEQLLGIACARAEDKAAAATLLVGAYVRFEEPRRPALLRVMGAVQQPETLAVVVKALSDPSTHEAAARTLAGWTDPAALAPLKDLALGEKDEALRRLAAQAVFRLLGEMNTPVEERTALLAQVLPSVSDDNGRRAALSALGKLPTPGALAMATDLLARAEVRNEAALAVMNIVPSLMKDRRVEAAQALKRLLEVLPQGEPATKAKDLLKKMEEGFKPMFNGKDLSGWKCEAGWWRVEDGAITGETTPEKTCAKPVYLVWEGGAPADFELRARYRLRDGNSGIQFRSVAKPDGDVDGYQADMEAGDQYSGCLYEPARFLVGKRGESVEIAPDGKRTVTKLGDPAELQKLIRKNDWNDYAIVAVGPEIRLYINGVLMTHVVDRQEGRAAAKGIVALQLHPGPPMKIEFKDLQLRTLAP